MFEHSNSFSYLIYVNKLIRFFLQKNKNENFFFVSSKSSLFKPLPNTCKYLLRLSISKISSNKSKTSHQPVAPVSRQRSLRLMPGQRRRGSGRGGSGPCLSPQRRRRVLGHLAALARLPPPSRTRRAVGGIRARLGRGSVSRRAFA